MKKTLLFLTLAICFQLRAQIKEGTVKYAMKVDGNNTDIGSQILGSTTFTIYFKNDKALMEMGTPAYTMRTLTDNTGVLMLMDAAGQKFFTRRTRADLEAAKKNKKAPDPVITYSKEKKKILGYDCTKATVSITGGKGKAYQMILWHTDKIRNIPGVGPINGELLENLKGMALELEMEQGGVKSRMTATEVSTRPLPDRLFTLSTTGYLERKLPK